MSKPLYAQVNVAIAGIHFAKGETIKGVDDDEQVAICIRLKKVGPKKPRANKKAPEKKAVATKPEVNDEAELTGEGGDSTEDSATEAVDGDDSVDAVDDVQDEASEGT